MKFLFANYIENGIVNTDSITFINNIIRFGVHENPYFIASLLINIIAFSVLFWQVLKGLKKYELLAEINNDTLSANKVIESRQSLFNQNEKQIWEIAQKLENHMKVNEPFMESSLSVYDLATQINVASRDLSIAINHILNKHFFDYVNEYRIKKAMALFQQATDEKLTVLEVLYEVGFNSKSSFNTAFKKFVGQTPSQYRKSA